MASVNKVILLGTLGRDPELSHTNGGLVVCKLSVATNEEWVDKQTGEKRKRTDWHRVVAFGKQAEILAQYLSKGSQIFIDGKNQTSEYEKDGVKRYSTDILVNSFQFIGPPKQQQRQQQQQQQQWQQPPQQQQFTPNQGQSSPHYDDFPF